MKETENSIELTGALSEDGESVIVDHAKIMKRVLLRRFSDKKLIITVSVFYAKRSDAQNRYMWGVVVPMVKAWLLDTNGDKRTKDEVYLWLNQAILGNKPAVKSINGYDVVALEGKRFSAMSTKEFGEAVEKIQQYFSQFDLSIPNPNEQNLITDHLTDN
jgi:hypothetical protein